MEGEPYVGVVGREEELRRLRDLVSRGAPLVLVCGEAGVGKTVLVNELAAQLRAEGVTVHRGTSDSIGGRRFALWAQVAAALGVELPDEDFSVEPSEQTSELIALLVSALENSSTAAVLLEDLHRADASSLVVLQTLTRDLVGARVTLIATMRDEPGARDATLEALARTAHTVRLSGLSNPDVRRLIATTSGIEPDRDVVEAFMRRTGGNPLLIRELAASGEQRPPSRDVIEMLASSMERVGANVMNTLGVLAIAGPSALLTTVAAVAGIDVGAVATHLDVAADAEIVVSDERGRRWFRHDLLADAAAHRVGPDGARGVHLALARALEGVTDGRRVDRVRHLASAVPLVATDTVATAALEAADWLMLGRRVADAADVLEASLRATADYGLAADIEGQLWLALGEARWQVGDERGALEAFASAADHARDAGNVELIATAEVARHRRLLPMIPDPLGRARLAAIDTELPEQDSPVRVALLGRRAIFELQTPADRTAAERLTEDALAMARRIDDPGVLLGALSDRYYLGTTTRACLDERAGLAAEAIDLARRAGRPEQMLIGYEWRFASELEQGRLFAATRVLDEIEALATVSPGPSWIHSATLRRAVVLALQGDRDGALAMTSTTGDLSSHLPAPQPLAVELALRDPIARIYLIAEEILLDRLETSLHMFDRVPSPFLQIRNANAEVHLGRVDDARRRARPLLQHPENAFEGPTPILTFALMSHLVVRLQLRECAPSLAAAFGEFGGLLATDTGRSPELPVDLYLASLSMLAGDTDRAVRLAHAAIELARSMPSPPLEARALVLLAGAQAMAGNHSAADAAHASAEALAEPIGLVLPASQGDSRRTGGSAGGTHLITVRAAGDAWHLTARDGEGEVPNMIGMTQLLRLVTARGHSVSASDLAGIGAGDGPPMAADLGPVLDARAKREYRHRIMELQSDVDDAERMADIGRAAAARAELDTLLDHLRAATGLGGRDRRSGGSDERARINVARNIRRAIAAIRRVSPEAAAHLATSVRTGHACRYEPDPSSTIQWEIEPRDLSAE